MKPQYPHDCKYCDFVGVVEGYDVYVCSNNGDPILYVKDGRKRENYFTGVDLVLGRVNLTLNLTAVLRT